MGNIVAFCVACGKALRSSSLGGWSGLFKHCSCETPEPVAIPEATPHWWGEWRGPACFCRRCGDHIGEDIYGAACPGDLGPTKREENIEEWIGVKMRVDDRYRLPVVRDEPEPAWSNITAALNAPPGWNRR